MRRKKQTESDGVPMFNCENAVENARKYADGEFSAEEKKGYEAHIAACDACRHEAETEKELSMAIKSAINVPVPNDFMDRINCAIDNDEKKSKKVFLRRFIGRRTVSTVAACFVIAVVLSLNGGGRLTDEINSGDSFKNIQIQPSEDNAVISAVAVTEDANAENVTDLTETEQPKKKEKHTEGNKTKKNTEASKKKNVSVDTSVEEKTGNMSETAATPETEAVSAEANRARGVQETSVQMYDNDNAAALCAEEAKSESISLYSVYPDTEQKKEDALVVHVNSENIEEVKKAASERGEVCGEEFEMTAEEYKSFLEYLQLSKIEYRAFDAEGDTVVFSVEAE